MLGLSLLYVDERVRHEGYDIELMAARQLGEVPDINVTSPLGTALYSEKKPPPVPRASQSHRALAGARGRLNGVSGFHQAKAWCD